MLLLYPYICRSAFRLDTCIICVRGNWIELDICIYINIHSYIYTYIHTRTYIYIHIYAYIYKYIYHEISYITTFSDSHNQPSGGMLAAIPRSND